jgi:hypothetical protein
LLLKLIVVSFFSFVKCSDFWSLPVFSILVIDFLVYLYYRPYVFSLVYCGLGVLVQLMHWSVIEVWCVNTLRATKVPLFTKYKIRILLSEVYCVWQVVKARTIIPNNSVYLWCSAASVSAEWGQSCTVLMLHTKLISVQFNPSF